MTQGHKLATDTRTYAGQSATGFATPISDKKPQVASFAPKRVIPVIFLPGIMGSNLRMTSQERIDAINSSNNVAWRPDNAATEAGHLLLTASAADRQLMLDPATTEVDVYDLSGPSKVSGDERNDNVELAETFSSPLLADDPPGAKNGRSAAQKARLRGWGEVYFKSYGQLLQTLEMRLNGTFSGGKLRPIWKDVVGVDPRAWMPDAALPQKPLGEDELKQVATGCWFPVFAFGYNWLQSNGDSARAIAQRITAAIDSFNSSGYECPGVIVATHSMGGMVGRALIHPDYGNLKDKVLGIVHGAQPAIGAAAAYKRIRAGFEDPGMWQVSGALIMASAAAKVAGNYGDEVTAVLANAPGGLQLLPNHAYGNGWLQVVHNGQRLDAWPKNNDPYEEIYKVRGKWYSLIREEWINPSQLAQDRGGGSFDRTVKFLDQAKEFHRAIANTYHDCSYAHYGADPARLSFGDVVWNVETTLDTAAWDSWRIRADTRQGRLTLAPASAVQEAPQQTGLPSMSLQRGGGRRSPNIHATILAPTEPGDQTVPMRSSDHQLRSGKFKGIFRQIGYEHQASYQDARALASTLFSIVRIAQQAKWKGKP